MRDLERYRTSDDVWELSCKLRLCAPIPQVLEVCKRLLSAAADGESQRQLWWYITEDVILQLFPLNSTYYSKLLKALFDTIEGRGSDVFEEFLEQYTSLLMSPQVSSLRSPPCATYSHPISSRLLRLGPQCSTALVPIRQTCTYVLLPIPSCYY